MRKGTLTAILFLSVLLIAGPAVHASTIDISTPQPGTFNPEVSGNLDTAQAPEYDLLKQVELPTKELFRTYDDDTFTGTFLEYNDLVMKGLRVYPVPEAGTALLLGAGLVGLIGYRRRRRME